MPARKNTKGAAKSAAKRGGAHGASTSAERSGGQSRAGQTKAEKEVRKTTAKEEREYLKARREQARAEAAAHLQPGGEDGDDTTDVQSVSWAGERVKPGTETDEGGEIALADPLPGQTMGHTTGGETTVED